MTGKVGQEDPAANSAGATLDQLKLSQAIIEKQNAETKLAAQRALKDAQKQLDSLQSNVNQLVQLTASAPLIVGQITPANQHKSAVSSNGFFNLNRLLEPPHQNTYLWAALALLGVLAVWAGLRIQSRKTNNALSTLIPSEDIGKSTRLSPQNVKLEMPVSIAELDLNLDLNPKVRNTLDGFRATASKETLQ